MALDQKYIKLFNDYKTKHSELRNAITLAKAQSENIYKLHVEVKDIVEDLAEIQYSESLFRSLDPEHRAKTNPEELVLLLKVIISGKAKEYNDLTILCTSIDDQYSKLLRQYGVIDNKLISKIHNLLDQLK